MSEQEIKGLLEKQLQLLSEQSMHCINATELAELTGEMIKAAGLLLSSL